MALINRPLTEDEARKMVEDWRKRPYGAALLEFWRLMEEAYSEPFIHMVLYFRATDTHTYVGSDTFYLGPPGDCTYFIREAKRR